MGSGVSAIACVDWNPMNSGKVYFFKSLGGIFSFLRIKSSQCGCYIRILTFSLQNILSYLCNHFIPVWCGNFVVPWVHCLFTLDRHKSFVAETLRHLPSLLDLQFLHEHIADLFVGIYFLLLVDCFWTYNCPTQEELLEQLEVDSAFLQCCKVLCLLQCCIVHMAACWCGLKLCRLHQCGSILLKFFSSLCKCYTISCAARTSKTQGTSLALRGSPQMIMPSNFILDSVHIGILYLWPSIGKRTLTLFR